MVDVTTWIVWAPASFFFNINLTFDSAYPFLILCSWALMPFNALIFGIPTIVLFPMSVVFSAISIFLSYSLLA